MRKMSAKWKSDRDIEKERKKEREGHEISATKRDNEWNKYMTRKSASVCVRNISTN